MPKVEAKTRRMLSTIDRTARNDYENRLLTEMTVSHRTRELIPHLGRYVGEEEGKCSSVVGVVREVRKAAKGWFEEIEPDPSLLKRTDWSFKRTNNAMEE